MVCPGLSHWVVWTRHQDSGNQGLPGLSLSPWWTQSCLVVATSTLPGLGFSLRHCSTAQVLPQPAALVHVSPRSPGNQAL